MLSGYDFSNCDIPVCLSYFLLVNFEVDVPQTIPNTR